MTVTTVEAAAVTELRHASTQTTMAALVDVEGRDTSTAAIASVAVGVAPRRRTATEVTGARGDRCGCRNALRLLLLLLLLLMEVMMMVVAEDEAIVETLRLPLLLPFGVGRDV